MTKTTVSDLTALVERVTTAEANIVSNKSAIDSYVAITKAEVDGMFA